MEEFHGSLSSLPGSAAFRSDGRQAAIATECLNPPWLFLFHSSLHVFVYGKTETARIHIYYGIYLYSDVSRRAL
jgi:citrate lyase synthetase